MKKNFVPITTNTRFAMSNRNYWQKIKQHAKKLDNKLQTIFAVLSSVCLLSCQENPLSEKISSQIKVMKEDDNPIIIKCKMN